MIAPFLRSMADVLHRMISEGRAVHCTEADAAELEMLAGLPWKDAPTYAAPKAGQDDWWRGIEPTDIAFGWLKMSRARYRGAGPYAEIPDDDAQRAAACAELALLSVSWDFLAEYSELGETDPHHGTIDGARAAWAFILPALQHHAADQSDYAECQRILELARRYERELDALPHPSDKYRRELEAMRRESSKRRKSDASERTMGQWRPLNSNDRRSIACSKKTPGPRKCLGTRSR